MMEDAYRRKKRENEGHVDDNFAQKEFSGDNLGGAFGVPRNVVPQREMYGLRGDTCFPASLALSGIYGPPIPVNSGDEHLHRFAFPESPAKRLRVSKDPPRLQDSKSLPLLQLEKLLVRPEDPLPDLRNFSPTISPHLPISFPRGHVIPLVGDPRHDIILTDLLRRDEAQRVQLRRQEEIIRIQQAQRQELLRRQVEESQLELQRWRAEQLQREELRRRQLNREENSQFWNPENSSTMTPQTARDGAWRANQEKHHTPNDVLMRQQEEMIRQEFKRREEIHRQEVRRHLEVASHRHDQEEARRRASDIQREETRQMQEMLQVLWKQEEIRRRQEDMIQQQEERRRHEEMPPRGQQEIRQRQEDMSTLMKGERSPLRQEEVWRRQEEISHVQEEISVHLDMRRQEKISHKQEKMSVQEDIRRRQGAHRSELGEAWRREEAQLRQEEEKLRFRHEELRRRHEEVLAQMQETSRQESLTQEKKIQCEEELLPQRQEIRRQDKVSHPHEELTQKHEQRRDRKEQIDPAEETDQTRPPTRTQPGALPRFFSLLPI
eukprot:TRINITY_DN4575_c0_g1_i1.p1 TRINITY_DN4575_c0_g1~~TRINITY_DN4575_c0_g1_i1.p1  ORF type:complete len:550 (+),score=123.10 TRINITY_DN4575_c0_g1_i1:232-1881(+)